MRPYAVLSNGEKFRVDMARTLAEMPDLAVVDEFTSVVDRQVAQVGSSCVAKAVRRRGRKFVAVSCHYDILDWLQPDWVFQPHTGVFERRCLQRRPELDLEIHEAGRDAWPTFRPHHYLSAGLSHGQRRVGRPPVPRPDLHVLVGDDQAHLPVLAHTASSPIPCLNSARAETQDLTEGLRLKQLAADSRRDARRITGAVRRQAKARRPDLP